MAIKELEWQVGQSIRFFTGQRATQWLSQNELDRAMYELHSLRHDPNTPFGPEDNGGARVISRDDQERVKCEFPYWPERYHRGVTKEKAWGSVFWHCDNIRFICESERVNVPQWYSEKYGHMFARPPVVF